MSRRRNSAIPTSPPPSGDESADLYSTHLIDYRPAGDYRCGALPVIFSVDEKTDLLPHFVDYYRERGVTDFVCVAWEGADLGFVCRTLEASGLPHLVVAPGVPFFLGFADSHLHNQIREAHVDPGGWCMVLDLDEFVEIPGFDLREACARAEADGAVAICGEFVDRIAADGSLPASLEADIWAQFPLQTRMTLSVKTWTVTKAVAVRGDTAVTSGHHYHEGAGRSWCVHARVHHFAWWGDVTGRMKERLLCVKRVKLDWGGECSRTVETIEKHGGKLPLTCPPGRDIPRHWKMSAAH